MYTNYTSLSHIPINYYQSFVFSVQSLEVEHEQLKAQYEKYIPISKLHYLIF